MLWTFISYDKVEVPEDGEPITLADEETGALDVPDTSTIPLFHGDGIGPDVGPAALQVLDAAGEATGRSIAWMRLYAGEDKVNPTAMIRSGRIMLEYIGWKDAATLVKDAVEATISAGTVTYDRHQ